MNRLSFWLRRASGLLLVVYLVALVMPLSSLVVAVTLHPVFRLALVLAVAYHAIDTVALAWVRRRRAARRRPLVVRVVLAVSLLIVLLHVPIVLGGPAVGGG